jgi:hypothetical protein
MAVVYGISAVSLRWFCNIREALASSIMAQTAIKQALEAITGRIS